MAAKSGRAARRNARKQSSLKTKLSTKTKAPTRGKRGASERTGATAELPAHSARCGHHVYLSLGSNRGERAGQIERALDLLAQSGVRIVKQSAIYETEPVGFRDQHWFLNCVVEGETQLMPRQLVRAAQRIEREMGRQRDGTRYAPRNIDIDVLLFGTTKMRTSELEIPHPRMAERNFVLAPLAEIAPSLRHPILHLTAAEMLAATSDRSRVRKLLS